MKSSSAVHTNPSQQQLYTSRGRVDAGSAPDIRVTRRSRRPRASYPGRIVICILAVALAGLALTASALADDVVVAPTTVSLAKATGATALSGMSVSGYSNPSEPLLVSVSTTLGSLSLSETSGLTLSYGYSAFNGEELSFVGDQTDVQAALETLVLSDGGTTGTASVSMTVTAQQAGISYLPATGHYYKYVAAAEGSWSAARAGAQSLEFAGQKGYLASIPSATVNNFIEAHLNGAENVWAGGKAGDYPAGFDSNPAIKRVWRWTAGPLQETVFTECANLSETCEHVNDSSDFHDWGPGEPNNSGYPEGGDPGEHQLEINYEGKGTWNDLANFDTTTSGYVVEFGNLTHGGEFTGVYTASSNVTLANPPSAPLAVSGAGNSFEGGAASVVWSAPEDEGNSSIIEYTVTASPGGETCISTLLPECIVTGLTNGTEYVFTVTATNAIGTGTASSESAAVNVSGAPGDPSGASAVYGAEQVTVSWAAPPDNGSPITGYTVTAEPGGETCTTPDETICTVRGLENGLEYTFTVTATNGNGAGGPSSISSATPSAAPGSPSGVSVVSGVRQATVSWNAPPNNGSPITGYTVTAAPGGATCSTWGAASCTVTGLAGGTTYTFTVTASNINGSSSPSSASNSVIPMEPLTPTITSTNVTIPPACISARSEMVHWKVHAGQHMRRIVITLNGAVYARLPGSARSAVISLAGRKAGAVAVKITGTRKDGRTSTGLRMFHPCAVGHSTGSPASLYLAPGSARRR